jgi:IclR family acetate operon transcriptional repressor
MIAAVQSPSGARSIERAAQLLVRVVESDEPETVSELAETTGLPRSTASRLVAALESQGLVERDGGRGSIRPGPVLVSFARRSMPSADLTSACAPALERLADATGETANLAVPAVHGVEQLAQRDSRHFLGSTNWVGRTVPYHASAVGKVFLAYGAVTTPATLEQLTARTIVDREDLSRELDETRDRGYATAVEELEPGLWAVAAPLHGTAGVIGSLSVSGPSVRFHEGLLEEVGTLLVNEASSVSKLLQGNQTREDK